LMLQRTFSNQRRTMHYYAQVLLNSTPSATPSLYIRFDSAGYLINCPEGTQRFCFEHQIKLTKAKSIIFTRNSWSAIGGLPGIFSRLCLTARDAFDD
jgi:ribonuclease Z